MEWLKERAGEASTWHGLGMLLAAAGLLPVAGVDLLVSAALAIIGLVGVVAKDKK